MYIQFVSVEPQDKMPTKAVENSYPPPRKRTGNALALSVCLTIPAPPAPSEPNPILSF